MKQKLFIPLVIIMIAFASVGAAFAQEPQRPPQLDYINAQLDVFLPRLETFQTQYYDLNGQYFQALTSHTTAPAGVEAADIATHPTDQEAVLASLWEYSGLPLETNWSLKIDTYNGPDGAGYVLTVSTVVNNETWIKSVNYGPDIWRAADWYQFVPFSY